MPRIPLKREIKGIAIRNIKNLNRSITTYYYSVISNLDFYCQHNKSGVDLSL